VGLSPETSLLAKALWSAALVVGLSFVAERASTRIAGILSGAPQNTLLVYLFVGRDMGIPFVTESVPYGIAAFTATIGFALAYYAASLHFTRCAALWSALIAVTVFVALAALLSTVPFTLVAASALTISVTAAAAWLFRRIEPVRIERPVRYTARLIAARGALAAALIVVVITLAEILGPRWTGLLTGFPSIVLPTLLIIHVTYGRASTHALLRHFPLGLLSIIVYMISVPVTFPLLDIYGGTLASLVLSIICLSAVALWTRSPR
jgi:hypothetical protein